MRQIVYFSTSAIAQTHDVVEDILVTSRANNRRDQITGLLVAGGNRYMQIIEGPRANVDRLYRAIRADDRHLAVSTLLSRVIYARSFDGWSMAFRRQPEFAEFDRFPDMVRLLTEQLPDSRLRSQIRNFAGLFIAAPAPHEPLPWKIAG